MKKAFTLLFIWLSTLPFSTAQEVNFSEDIASIIYNKCTSCHRPGEIGPMSFTNYEEVASWAGMIQYVTEIKYMPPWKPDKEYSHFVGERGLSDEEIQLISDWVAQGTPQGDPSLEPALPNFPSGSQLGIPDLVLEMSEAYFIEGNNQDDYRVFVLPTGLTEDKEIAAVEFRPGNTKAVHHALMAYEVNGAAAAKAADSPGYGYEAFGGYGVPVQGNFIGYTPGISTIRFPTGIGTTLPAGADLLLQVHYAPLPIDATDQSLVNIFFKEADDPITREIERMPATPFDLVGGFLSFRIPPNEVTTFEGVKDIEEDISLLSIYPHCHYLGQSWEIFAVPPVGDTINVIRIKEWDFNWQGAYTVDRLKKIPAGSKLHINATYDNTSNNPFNPSNPPQLSTWGEATTEEMYLVGINYIPYQDGDENILIGDNITTNTEEVSQQSLNRLEAPFPNPSNGSVAVTYFLENQQYLNMEIFD
ncbi:MAG: cytochrome c, partial [Bacteroidota bacterium]